MNLSSLSSSTYSQSYSELSSTSQTDRATKLLSQMDSDGDGKVSQTEFAAFDEAMKAQAPEGPPPPPPPTGDSEGVKAPSSNQGLPSPEALFSTGDADGDGSLSLDELSAMLAAGPQNAPPVGGPPSSDALFSTGDTDGDGSLSVTELSAMFQAAPTGESTTSTTTTAAPSMSDLLADATDGYARSFTVDELSTLLTQLKASLSDTSGQ
jgi:Ca2+-binding EF-hand superfamily protein